MPADIDSENMKLIQERKIIRVIERERKLITSALAGPKACRSPGHCAVGALLFAAGMSNPQLRKMAESTDQWYVDDPAATLLYRTYGLRIMHVSDIMNANDDSNGASIAVEMAPASVAQRKVDVIKVIRELAAKQRRYPKADARRCDAHDSWQPKPLEIDRD